MTQQNDPDATILRTVVGMKGFLQSVLIHDRMEDWNIAKSLGELLVRICPDEVLGHALLARSFRHLGSTEEAAAATAECRRLLAHNSSESEKELFEPLVQAEEREINDKK